MIIEKHLFPFQFNSEHAALINSKLDLIPITAQEDFNIAAVALKNLAQQSNSIGYSNIAIGLPSFSDEQHRKKLIQKIKVLYEYPEACVGPNNQDAFKFLLNDMVNKKSEELASFTPEQEIEYIQHLNFLKEINLLTPGREDLVQLTKALYQRSSEKGVCYGFAIMGMQAILSRTLDVFDLRLNKLALLLAQYSGEKNFNEIVEEIKKDKDFDLMAFFEGIKLGMHFYQYEELFETERKPEKHQLTKDHIEVAIKLITSKALSDQGELINLGNFTGAYNEMNMKTDSHTYILSELSVYFSILKKIVDSTVSMFSCQEEEFFFLATRGRPITPIAFVLRNSSHAITVGYDPLEKNWLLIDDSQISKRKMKNSEEIVQCVQKAFLETRVKMMEGEFDIYPIAANVYIVNREDVAEIYIWNRIWDEFRNNAEIMRIQKHNSESVLKNGFWLVVAAQEGDTKLIHDLLADGAVMNVKVANNRTALMWAVETGNIEAIKALIEAGADKNAKLLTGESVLEIAYYSKRNWEEVVEVLIEFKINVNEEFSDGFTALAKAAFRGNERIVRLLLEAEAVVNEPGSQDMTPLIVASMKGYAGIVELLLKFGAIRDYESSLQHALKRKHMEVVRVLTEFNIQK